jgi:hypothetical protein
MTPLHYSSRITFILLGEEMDYSVWVQEIQQQERDQRERNLIEEAQYQYDLRLQQLHDKQREKEHRNQHPLPYLRDIELFPRIREGFLRKVYPPIGFLKNKFTPTQPWYQTGSHFDHHHRSYIDSLLNMPSSDPIIREVKFAYICHQSLPKDYSFHSFRTCNACHNLQKTYLRRYQINKRKYQSRRTRKRAYRYFRLLSL